MYFLSDSIPNRYKTQKMCDKAGSEDYFTIVFCPDKYKSQRMCDEAVDCFVTKKIRKLYTALYTDEHILYFDEVSGSVILPCNEMSILNIDLNNINLDNNFDEDDPCTVILIKLLAWHIKFKKRKALKEYSKN